MSIYVFTWAQRHEQLLLLGIPIGPEQNNFLSFRFFFFLSLSCCTLFLTHVYWMSNAINARRVFSIYFMDDDDDVRHTVSAMW